MMIALWEERIPACASAARISVNPNPPSARPPILRNSRREIPSQKRCRSPLMVSTQAPPWLQRQKSVEAINASSLLEPAVATGFHLLFRRRLSFPLSHRYEQDFFPVGM